MPMNRDIFRATKFYKKEDTLNKKIIYAKHQRGNRLAEIFAVTPGAEYKTEVKMSPFDAHDQWTLIEKHVYEQDIVVCKLGKQVFDYVPTHEKSGIYVAKINDMVAMSKKYPQERVVLFGYQVACGACSFYSSVLSRIAAEVNTEEDYKIVTFPCYQEILRLSNNKAIEDTIGKGVPRFWTLQNGRIKFFHFHLQPFSTLLNTGNHEEGVEALKRMILYPKIEIIYEQPSSILLSTTKNNN